MRRFVITSWLAPDRRRRPEGEVISQFSMKIHQLVIPTPFYVGPINIYLVDEEPLTLIDTGPKTDEALEAVRAQMAGHGRRIEDLERIVLTHTHEDHCGLARRLQEISGAMVCVHEWEARRLAGDADYHVYQRLLKKMGVPDQTIAEFQEGYRKIGRYREPVETFRTYKDEDELVFANGSMLAVHTPGHTTGSTCFFRESNRLLLSGDTVLKRITPNPVLFPDPFDELERFKSLSEYLCSMARIRELSPTLIRTAHGGDITDFGEHFNRTVRMAEERQQKIISSVPKSGCTAFEMAGVIFPDAKDLHNYLALSEVSAHLDLATSDGKIRLEKRNDVDVFVPLSD